METLVQAFKEPFIWYWDSARACILKERKPFQHRRNIIKEWYDAKTNELITDCYRRYSEIKKKDGKYAAEIARKGWVEKERAVEWDEYRYLKIWEVSETVFGCSYLGGYECQPVDCSNTLPYKSIEEAIEKLYEYWEVYKAPLYLVCRLLLTSPLQHSRDTMPPPQASSLPQAGAGVLLPNPSSSCLCRNTCSHTVSVDVILPYAHGMN